MKNQFVSLCTSFRYTISGIALLSFLPFISFAALSPNNPALDLLTRVSFFIKELVIPVLFGIAFLFFLINMVRYYMLGAANEESRTKARRNTLYGLAAFVFLMSIWSIISLVLGGLKIDRSSEALCPDYLKDVNGSICDTNNKGAIENGGFGHVSFPGTGVTGTGGTGTGGTEPGDTGPGGTGTGGGTNGGSTGGGTSNFSGLSELIFGTGKDSSLFTRYTGGPRAVYQTPAIAASATCKAGLDTLLFANTVETAQAAYVLYKNSNGATRWKNITDLSSTNHITYDKDELDSLLRTNVTDVHIIHTHQNTRTENLGLVMEGHGPSSADMKTMCNNNDTDITYTVVDWNGIWTLKQQSDTCPYSTTASNILPVIETYGALASLEASTRQSELFQYTNSSVTPSQYKNHFSSIDTQQFPDLTPEEVLSLSNYYQTYASTTVTYQQAADTFCSTF